MFSLHRFYNIIHNNLIAPFNRGWSIYFHPFGTYKNTMVLDTQLDIDVPQIPIINWLHEQEFFHCYFFDQEPLYDYTMPIVKESFIRKNLRVPTRINILANSEQSDIKHNIAMDNGMHEWYYFYHGFAALDWYRDFQYVTPDSFSRFNRVFICYNHLISKYRSHRLHLVSNLLEKDLVKHGYVSLFLQDESGTWKDEIEDPNSMLDNRARVKIHHALKNVTEPLVIDTDTPTGAMSADVKLDQLTSALWHIVTETVYFLPKLHLTEKVFKPIVAKRPFILVAAPGNLAYIKSYGFKTFDRWIDESYDEEQDHYIRIEKITAEIARLCAMDNSTLSQMHLEMQQVLEYNFKHFYGDFKKTIVNELVDNFTNILDKIDTKEYQFTPDYVAEVKHRLIQ